MSKAYIENIAPEDYEKRGVYTPAKKVDMGNFYQIYVTDMNEFDKVSEIRGEYFKNAMPVSTLVEVNRMTRTGAKIEIEVTAIVEK